MPLQLLAEYDNRFDTVMIAWPHEGTDWAPMLSEAKSCYVGIVKALVRSGCIIMIVAPDIEEVKKDLAGVELGRTVFAQVVTNDTWTRDYGPLTLGQTPEAPGESENSPLAAADFQFNGWGLKFAANYDNQVTSKLFGSLREYRDMLGTVLEGGSVETDGKGTMLTTSECLLSKNRNNYKSKEEAGQMLSRSLGAERVLWLDHGALEGDDTDSHVDTLARMAPHDTIFYVKSYNPCDPQTRGLDLMEEQLREMTTADGQPYTLVGLPLPDPCLDPDDGHRLPATYANFLITPRAVIMPVYGQPDNDRMARQMLEMVFSPEREVITVDCRALIRQHGSLHCATMQLPSSFLTLKK